MKMQHQRIAGLLYIAFGIFGVVAGCHLQSNDPATWSRLSEPRYRAGFIMFAIGFAIFAVDVLFGICLALHKRWTLRMPGYVVTALNFTIPPIGSLLAMYSLLIQLREWKQRPNQAIEAIGNRWRGFPQPHG